MFWVQTLQMMIVKTNLKIHPSHRQRPSTNSTIAIYQRFLHTLSGANNCGTTGNMIRSDIAHKNIKPSSHSAYQADGLSPLHVAGERMSVSHSLLTPLPH